MSEESGSRKIRVCLAGSERLIRELLALLLRKKPHFDLVAICESLEGAFAEACSGQIDVLLLDFRPVNRVQVDSVAALRDSPSPAKVIVLADSVNDEEAIRLAWCGVAGIFFTSGSADLLLKCVDKVAGGECWFDQNIVQAILHQAASLSGQNPTEGSDKLTKREMQVLRLVLDGLSNKEIATRMALRETSVKGVLQGLFHKNGVRSRSQLVRVALERQLGSESSRGSYPPPATV